MCVNIIVFIYMDNINNISQLYENENYFDQYGGTLVVFVIITICTLLIVSYLQVMANVQPIINDWTNQRCKPSIIPFAGFITHPEGVSAGEYTSQNFNYCMQNILSNISGVLLEPLTFVTHSLTSNTSNLQSSIQSVRGMFDKIRTSMQSVSEEIMGRIMNVVIPLLKMIIEFKDITGKIQGILTASLYTSLGAYYSFRSLMGAIAQFIVTILIILAALIAGLWMVPVTWGAAAANTVIFTAIAVPMAIILTFMNDTLHINSGLSIPTVKCFDKNTMILMQNGNYKPIMNIQLGDILPDNNIITAKIKVATEGSTMYSLNNIIVSNSHLVKYESTWIRVSEHPKAVLIDYYNEPYLYCLNTSKKYICINEFMFSDWDELYDDNLKKILTILGTPNNPEKIHNYLDYGFKSKTKIALNNDEYIHIDKIQIGSILKNGEKVYGIVEIDGSTLVKVVKSMDELKLYNLLTNVGCFEIDNQCIVNDYNWTIDYFFN